MQADRRQRCRHPALAMGFVHCRKAPLSASLILPMVEGLLESGFVLRLPCLDACTDASDAMLS